MPGGGLSEPLQGGAAPVPHSTPLFLLFVASVFEMVAASVLCTDHCTSYAAYAVTVGTVSAAACVAIFLCQVHRDTLPYALHSAPTPLSGFLLVWWLFGWFVLTFIAPFTDIGNGFFGSWTAMAAAMGLCHAHVPLANSWISQLMAMGRGSPVTILAGLALSSTLVAIEATVAITERGGREEVWGFVLGMLSAVVSWARVLVGAPLAK